MPDIDCEVIACGAKATHRSTVATVNYRETSFFCTDHKDSGYVPGVPMDEA